METSVDNVQKHAVQGSFSARKQTAKQGSFSKRTLTI